MLIDARAYALLSEFVVHRHAIFERRYGLENDVEPNVVFDRLHFANVFRVLDRSSQFLLREVIYDEPRPLQSTIWRVMFYRWFNKPATWERLCAAGLELEYGQDPGELRAALDAMKAAGYAPTTSAYYVPAIYGGKAPNYASWCEGTSRMVDVVAPVLDALSPAKALYDALKSVPGVGVFIAHQLAVDLMYTPFGQHLSEDDYFLPGPGCKEGAMKVFPDLAPREVPDAVRYLRDTQEVWLPGFGGLFGRQLTLSDVEHALCEMTRYARVRSSALAEGALGSNYTRRYKPTGSDLELVLPPHWRLNV